MGRSTTSNRPSASTPNPPRFTITSAWPCEDRGRLDEAIDHLRQSVSIDPKSAYGQLNLGVALYRKGRVDEAFGHLQQAVNLDPNYAHAHANLAVPLRARGRVAEAIDHLQQAVRLEGEKPTEIRRRLVLYRYEAACANVQSAAGQGSEDARRGEPERAGKRRQALDWLRANLELTAKLRNDGEVLGWSLATWLSDPALASVRDRRRWRSCPTPSASRGGDSGRTWRRVSPLTRWSKGGSAPPGGNGIGRSTAMRGT